MSEKMRIIGIVCEYNPFHEGHRYMMEELRRWYGEDTAIVCLMSGDFVQRGEPAVYKKQIRAKTALEAGANLVLELPFPYSASVAEHFSLAAVEIFKKCGIIDTLAFGSEEKNAVLLDGIATRLSAPAFLKAEAQMKKSAPTLSFPKRRDAAYLSLYGTPLALKSNEILGVGYLSAMRRTEAPFEAVALPMLEGVHATEKRAEIYQTDTPHARMEEGERTVLTMLRLHPDRKNRFVRAAGRSIDLPTLFSAVRTAGDTDARLKRELLHTLLHTPKEAEKQSPQFTVLLGADEVGQKLLRDISKNGEIEVVTKKGKGATSPQGREQFARYLAAEGFYTAFMTDPITPADFMAEKPIILKKHLHS